LNPTTRTVLQIVLTGNKAISFFSCDQLCTYK
jgi:hypothetical protein